MPRLSVRTKLLLSVLLILAPVLGLLLASFQADYARQRTEVLGSLTQTAQTVAIVADATFDEAITLGWAIASEPAVQTLDPALIESHVRQLGPRFPHFENLFVADASGRVRWTLIPLLPGAPSSVADRAYFQRVMGTGQPAMGDLIISRVTGGATSVLAVPVVAEDGQVLGTVGIALDLADLGVRLENVGLQPGQAIGLVDRTGRVALLTGWHGLTWEERDLSAVPEVQAALAGRSVQTAEFRGPLLGDTRGAAFVPTPRHGWVVGVTWPTAQAFGPLEAAFRLQLLSFAAIALLSLLGTALLGVLIVRPVAELAAQAEALGQGNLDQRVQIKTGDELESLGRTFNVMAERLQAALRLREEFLAAAAHELRTPATSLKGYAQLLQRREPRDEVERRILLHIAQAAERAGRLARELVEIYPSAQGSVPLQPAPLDLLELVRQRVEAARAMAERQRFLICAAGPVMVQVDRERLALVLGALLENAARYQPQGGPVHVTVAETHGEATVEVRDFGAGIAFNRLAYVFEPLFEPWPPGSRHYVGVVGLSLYLARSIVEAHGGRIDVESREGQGSTFRFSLPLPGPAA